MDYSLLIGIHDCKLAAEEYEAEREAKDCEPHEGSDSEDYDSGER